MCSLEQKWQDLLSVIEDSRNEETGKERLWCMHGLLSDFILTRAVVQDTDTKFYQVKIDILQLCRLLDLGVETVYLMIRNFAFGKPFVYREQKDISYFTIEATTEFECRRWLAKFVDSIKA